MNENEEKSGNLLTSGGYEEGKVYVFISKSGSKGYNGVEDNFQLHPERRTPGARFGTIIADVGKFWRVFGSPYLRNTSISEKIIDPLIRGLWRKKYILQIYPRE